MKRADILIVDDDANLCKSMRFVLQRKGYAVATAGGGMEAVSKVSEKTFDMVFMDIKMSGMNGVAACREIKRIKPGVPIAMMTAYSTADLIRQALGEGACTVLRKPLDPEDVVSLIEGRKGEKSRARVLVVDDDPAFCILIGNILSRQGYVVSTAHTGEEAAAMAVEQEYDIVLIDMKLPAANGLQTYLTLKEINPRIEAIMVTGRPLEAAELMEEALASCARACLCKPVDVERLLLLMAEPGNKRQEAAQPDFRDGNKT